MRWFGLSKIDVAMGLAFQKGAVPLSREALRRAIELNGVAVGLNQAAFEWGRVAAIDPARLEKMAVPAQPVVLQMPESLDALMRRHVAFLTQYQDAGYAQQYRRFVERVQVSEQETTGQNQVSRVVAQNLFRLMAYKDEYEVARLYCDPEFRRQLEAQFEGDFTLQFHLAPPLLSRTDARGHLVKRRFGGATMYLFRLLRRLRWIRGSVLDVFGHTAERRQERALITEYRDSVTDALPLLSTGNHPAILELARWPEGIRGFGYVKQAAIDTARKRKLEKWSRVMRAPWGKTIPFQHV